MPEVEVVPMADVGRATWDDFCARSDEAWFWHTSNFISYTIEQRPDLRPMSRSFAVSENSRLLALCPVIVEAIPASEVLPSRTELTFATDHRPQTTDHGPAPAIAAGLARSLARKVRNFAFAELEKLAAEENAVRIALRAAPLAQVAAGGPFTNAFPRYGYLDSSLETQIIDLTLDECTLLRAMTKGHRSDISRASRVLNVVVNDASNVSALAIDSYRDMHRRASGKVTRPDSTFDMMRDWISAGMGALFGAREGGEYVGFTLIASFGQGAYYFSACSEPGRRDLSIGHVLQWEAMRWMKARGYRYYEVGWQYYAPQLHWIPTAKDLQIARFKRGFGGDFYPYFRGEKFLSPEFFSRVATARIENYVRAMQGD